ncbi:hypothetical protein AUEXF2481DRAFT_44878 [Aureobasidium subglaciale EXF-2481]|uniref:Uncharacterized protein n=1 Tax=Aureobasidium subglaciale (strain EXF-2481) TaxID=1043005 RepID=A0A074Y420_AURSE|nr:uncharacterized protein AUEXF2481DRAFT_44878 [Aureobasidium subglaciale EXF-2481]KEQ90679.1 hypothetical protein AUEXF2481DRAFT_44878 [Aureobasidium subglaciale EXF-2481]
MCKVASSSISQTFSALRHLLRSYCPTPNDGNTVSTISSSTSSSATSSISSASSSPSILTTSTASSSSSSIVSSVPSSSSTLTPGTVTSYTTLPPGDTGYTSTVPPSGTISGTVIIGTPVCSVPTNSVTMTAAGTAGATSTFSVPACATALRFEVVGGPGGQLGRGGGYGALVSGTIVVSPAQSIRAYAGGAGNGAAPGMGAYGNGGSAVGNGGGGGAASALYVNNDLIVVAGGGGGGTIPVSSGNFGAGNVESFTYPSSGGNGTANTPGVNYSQQNSAGNVLATSSGGSPGTLSAAGAGGGHTGYGDQVVLGNSGNGINGGNGVITQGTSVTSGSGGGGSGYYGGGSGASSYWYAGNVGSAIAGGGGGGSSYVSGSASNIVQYPSGFTVGTIVYSFA